jgi:hypothetical protein
MLVGAAYRGDLAAIKDAVGNGASMQSATAGAALAKAAGQGHGEVIAQMIELGADVHALDDLAIRTAARRRQYETVAVLLDLGADRDAIDGVMCEWACQAQDELRGGPSRDNCLVMDSHDPMRVSDLVKKACVTDRFAVLIGAPLIASARKDDRQLFADIWTKLPKWCQDRNKDSYMQFVKEGGRNPVIGPLTAKTIDRTQDGGQNSRS